MISPQVDNKATKGHFEVTECYRTGENTIIRRDK